MTYALNVDTFLRDYARTVDTFTQAQIPYAAERTINALALEVRDALRADLLKNLTVRSETSANFIRRSVQQPHEYRAKKGDLNTRVVLDRLGDGRSFLPSFATDGNTNRQGQWGPVAVPTRTLRSYPTEVIPRAFYPRALRVLESRGVDGGALAPTKKASRTRGRTKKGARYGAFQNTDGKWQILGKSRTFALDSRFQRIAPNQAGVYQRTGPGRGDIQMLWKYEDHVPLPKRIDYQRTVDEIVRDRLATLFDTHLAVAMATAR